MDGLTDLNFVPLPYTIVGVLTGVVAVALFFTHHISIMGSMFGVVSILLAMSGITACISGFININSQLDTTASRLLAE